MPYFDVEFNMVSPVRHNKHMEIRARNSNDANDIASNFLISSKNSLAPTNEMCLNINKITILLHGVGVSSNGITYQKKYIKSSQGR